VVEVSLMGCGHLTALQEWPPAARPCLPCGMLGGLLVLIRRWGFLVSGIPVARSSVVDERSDSLLGSRGGQEVLCAVFSVHALPCPAASCVGKPPMVVVLVQGPPSPRSYFYSRCSSVRHVPICWSYPPIPGTTNGRVTPALMNFR